MAIDSKTLEVGSIYEIDYTKVLSDTQTQAAPRFISGVYSTVLNPIKREKVKYIQILSKRPFGNGDDNRVMYKIQALDDAFRPRVVKSASPFFKDEDMVRVLDSDWPVPIIAKISQDPKLLEEIRTSARTRQLRPEIEHSYWGDAAKVLQNEVSPDVKKLIGARRSRKRSRKHRSTRKHSRKHKY